MDSFIVLVHVLFALLFALYIPGRLIRSFWGWKNPEKGKKIKHSFRYADWVFATLILLTGLYPLVMLGNTELYHILKLLLFCLVIYISRSAFYVEYTLVNLVSLVLVAVIIYLSFNRKPVFNTNQTYLEGFSDQMQLTEVERGKLIFESLCVNCHGADGTLGKFQAADLSQSQLNTRQKIHIVTNGSPLTVMPAFDQALSESGIESVVRYIEEVLQE